MAKEKLIPPDPKRCQALHREGGAFSFGPPGEFVRCRKKPICILKEKRPSKGTQAGSMSLCGGCEPNLYLQRPATEFIRTPIERKPNSKKATRGKV